MNSDDRLVKERLAIQEVIAEVLLAGDTDKVRRAAIRFRSHSLVALRMLEAKLPAACPTPEEELEWLLDELLGDLIRKLQILESEDDENERERLKRTLDELLFALAVIWKQPAPMTSAQVEAKLTEKDVRDHVKPRYDKLS